MYSIISFLTHNKSIILYMHHTLLCVCFQYAWRVFVLVVDVVFVCSYWLSTTKWELSIFCVVGRIMFYTFEERRMISKMRNWVSQNVWHVLSFWSRTHVSTHELCILLWSVSYLASERESERGRERKDDRQYSGFLASVTIGFKVLLN